jgi:adenylate kinase family enzyme
VITKLFIWGRPGSGKSTAVRYISETLGGLVWNIHNINDYPIFLGMAKSGSPKVKLMENGGFDVCIPSTYDEVLQNVKQQVEEIDKGVYEQSKSLVIIEFSRDHYQSALDQLGSDFLKDAYLLFIHADIDTCRNRIYNRMKHPAKNDDHPSVPEEIYETRFANDNIDHMQQIKQNGPFCKVEIISNMKSLRTFRDKLDDFRRKMFEVEEKPILAGCDVVTIAV